MTSAPAALAHPAPADVVPALLPSRDVVLARLADRTQHVRMPLATLFVLGLLRKDDGRMIAPDTVVQVAALLARSIRCDDLLGSSGPAEFVVVLDGTETAAKTAAERLVRAVTALGIDGLSAAAGIAPMTPGVTADELFRRAALSLTSARRVGPGTVIRYREPLS